MTSAVGQFAKAVDVVFDLCMAIESIHSLATTDEKDFISVASAVNRLVLVGFTSAELGCIVSGQKNQTLALLKKIEFLPRVAEVPIELYKSIKEAADIPGPMNLRKVVRIFERGIIYPTAGATNTSAQALSYQMKAYLEMSPEELSQVKEEIWDEDGPTGEYQTYDHETCTKVLGSTTEVASGSRTVKYLAAAGTAETVAHLGSILYQQLTMYFAPELIVLVVAVDHGPEAVAAPPAVLGENLLEQLMALDFQELTQIPQPLHHDEVFSQYVCPINLRPIRDPVRDSTNHMTLYERSAIVNWLNINPVSPFTHAPMTVAELEEMPALRALIDNRLHHHQETLHQWLHNTTHT